MNIEEKNIGWPKPKRKLVVAAKPRRMEDFSSAFNGRRPKLMIDKKDHENLTLEGYAKSLSGNRLIEKKSVQVKMSEKARILNAEF